METEWIFDERVLYICAALYIAIIAAIIWVIRRHMELDKVTEMFSRCSCDEPEPTEDGAYCMSCGKMIII